MLSAAPGQVSRDNLDQKDKVAKALGNKTPAVDGTELDSFSDKSDVSSWAVTGMEQAVKAGIVSGMTPDTLDPLANATRAQAPAMIYKLLGVLDK